MKKIIAARAIGRERTEEEKLRRHLYGDKGAKFSEAKRMCIRGEVSGCVTTAPTRDNLIAEFYNKDMTKKENNQLHSVEANPVVSIRKTGTYAPGGSSGTGYTEYVYLTVRFEDGQEAEIRPSYWYETLNMVFAQVYDMLGELPNPEEAHTMLAEALNGLVTYTPFAELDAKYRRPKFQNTLSIELPPELKGKNFRIRRVTPRECFRLMGVDDKDIDKIQATGLSNSAQYKLAGNSIVVDVLFHIFRKMFVETENEDQ